METNIRIKICGITRKEDALLAAELGAWAVGFIFVKNTPRSISLEKAAEIIKDIKNHVKQTSCLPDSSCHPELDSGSNQKSIKSIIQKEQMLNQVQHDTIFIDKIGVFIDESLEEIKNIVFKTGITKIQLHGSESPEFCEELANLTGKEIIKAIRVKSQDDLKLIPIYKDKVSFILLDSYSENESGGTGKIFDWEIAKKAKEQKIPIILAGGINPDNAKQSYKAVKPYALDISSGVEQSKGIKNSEKLKKLFSISSPE